MSPESCVLFGGNFLIVRVNLPTVDAGDAGGALSIIYKITVLKMLVEFEMFGLY